MPWCAWRAPPLEDAPPVDILAFVRVVATAQVIMPRSSVRLSAWRNTMSEAEQAPCFLAGANSIHTGDRLLTTPTFGHSQDHLLLSRLGLRPAAIAAHVCRPQPASMKLGEAQVVELEPQEREAIRLAQNRLEELGH